MGGTLLLIFSSSDICYRTALGSAIGTNNALNITVLSSDDPYGVVGFASDSVTVSIPEPFSDAENDPTLTVERIGAFGEVHVQWRLLGDASQDISESQGTITFPDQIGSVSLSLPVIRDDVMEPDEMFQVSANGSHCAVLESICSLHSQSYSVNEKIDF